MAISNPTPIIEKNQQSIAKTSVDPKQILPVSSAEIFADSLTLSGVGNRAPVYVYSTGHLSRRQGVFTVPAGQTVPYPIPANGKIDLSQLRYQGESLNGFFSAASSQRTLLGNGGALIPVTAGSVDPAGVGTAAWNTYTVTPAGSQQWINSGQITRIRQTGTIKRAKFYIVTPRYLNSFVIQIWRRASANANEPYVLVGESENLAPQIVTGSNDVMLATPIAGVREGDFYGVKVLHSNTATPVSFMRAEPVTGATLRYLNASNSNTAHRWEEATEIAGSSSNLALPIALYMDAPVFAEIGDSLIAGHTANYSGLETTLTNAPTTNLGYQLGLLYGTCHHNLGIGSQTTTQILARISQLTDVAPKIAILNGGVNDIDGGVISQATFIANWTSIIDTCVAANIIPVVLQIWPWTAGSNAEMQTRDAWNTALATLVSTKPTALLVNLDTALGQNRVGGDSGNLWDLKTAYNVGDVHLNEAGDVAAAAAMKTLIDTYLTSESLAL